MVDTFVSYLLRFRSTLDFTPGTRGWCYLIEQDGKLGKSQFDLMEDLLGDWRKAGLIPLDFVTADEKRAPLNLESLDESTPTGYAKIYATIAAECWKNYTPISFWTYQKYYIEEVVEKIDLRELFKDVCAEFHVPIWNAGGWSDINSRADLMNRFKPHDEAGRRCVLLYCGDLDPAGELISDKIRSNLFELKNAVHWSPDEDRLIIDRFGLNEDFVRANRLSWIEGLETSKGEYNLEDEWHPDHFKPYVQNYLKKYGAKKVEANALVVRAAAGRQLCRDAILKYIDRDGITQYEKDLAEEQSKVKKALPGVLREMLSGKGGNGGQPT
jgi:hypothetical protein